MRFHYGGSFWSTDCEFSGLGAGGALWDWALGGGEDGQSAGAVWAFGFRHSGFLRHCVIRHSDVRPRFLPLAT